MISSQNYPDIPTETDHEAFYSKVDLSLAPDHICKEHKFAFSGRSREVVCENCGYGFRFLPHQLTVKDGQLLDPVGRPIT